MSHRFKTNYNLLNVTSIKSSSGVLLNTIEAKYKHVLLYMNIATFLLIKRHRKPMNSDLFFRFKTLKNRCFFDMQGIIKNC